MNEPGRSSVATGRRQRGFTLIEALISMTVLSIILALLAAGLRVISSGWEKSAARIERLDMFSRAVNILRRDIEGVKRLVQPPAQRPSFVFEGRSDHLTFVVFEPPFPTRSGLYFIDYSMVPNGQEVELTRARAPYRQGMNAFPGATPANSVPLIQGDFRYLFSYAQTTGDATKWHASWPFNNRLPDLIRLEIRDSRRDAPLAPPITLRVRADAELGCLSQKVSLCSAKSDGELRVTAGSENEKNTKSTLEKKQPNKGILNAPAQRR